MDFDSLNNFVVLSYYLNYRKAAEALHITQPTLSKCIARLENELGMPLFIRNNRGVVLTRYAESVLPHAKAALVHRNAMTDGIFPSFYTQQHRTLSIGISSTRLQMYLPSFLKIYHERHPDEEIQLFDGTQDFLVEMFSEGRCDLLLATEIVFERLSHVEAILLDREPVRMLVPTHSPYAEKPYADIEDFRNERFIHLGDRHSYRLPLYNQKSLTMRICAAHSLVPNIIACQSIQNIPLMVASGMGVSIGTSMLNLYAKDCVTFLPIKGHENDTYNIYGYLGEQNMNQAKQFTLELKEHLAMRLANESASGDGEFFHQFGNTKCPPSDIPDGL